jgi:hypothetical protein
MLSVFYAMCHMLSVIMLNVIMLSAIMLNVIMLGVNVLTVTILNPIMMNVIIIVKRVSWFKSSLLLRINNKHTYKY